MMFSAKAEYACLASLELAVRYGDPKPVRLADIVLKHDIPPRFLVQILLQLKGAGLIASTRGASGGYHLARPPDRITLGDIMGVIERADPNPASRKAEPTPLATALHDIWDSIASARQNLLNETTLAHIVSMGQALQYVI